MNKSEILRRPVSALLADFPYLADFFAAHALPLSPDATPLAEILDALPEAEFERLGLDREGLTEQLFAFIAEMENFRAGGHSPLRQITILGGRDKGGRPEEVRIDLFPGDVVSVVGPTGSGKSRLLADIECLAQGDSPSGRRILIDGEGADEETRLSGDRRLVAQLSQNMNFVMDLSVREFLQMHAESRLVEDADAVIERIYATAVDLAGEPFTLDTAVTALSGGQSRALMIADVACLSTSPIVLIDEIENAGVDRRRALELLVQEEKIVLLATHDPLLALRGDRRLVIRNGAIVAVLKTSAEERQGVESLEALDRKLGELRDQVRQGARIDFSRAGF